jgi:PIN domain nuclease of toxin-antitoxin system
VTLLLDTHALLWWLADDPALTPAACTAIRVAGTLVFVSATTAWEISIKQALGKLKAPDDLEAALAASRFQPLPIEVNSYSQG